MSKKIIIVGGVAGGASAATRLRRNSEEDQITMYERGRDVSFSNCSLPYRLSGVVPETEDLLMVSPETFRDSYNIKVMTRHEVVAIDRAKKQVEVENLLTGETFFDPYDVLILSPGAKPIVPNFPGKELMPLYTLRNVEDIEKLVEMTSQHNEIAVIGGGFIGVEIAENLRMAGKNITLIEGTSQILRPYDDDMVQILHKELLDQGVNLILDDLVESIGENQITLRSGRTVNAEGIVLAIGVSPETDLAKACGLTLGKTGAIAVNKVYRTNDESIYAIGDAVEVTNELTGTPMKLALAGPAAKQARIVADTINDKPVRTGQGFFGSSAIKVFDYNAAATGLNEWTIANQNPELAYDIVHLILNDKVGLMPDANPMHFKLIFEVPSGKVLGAQAIGRGDVTKRIDVIATVMHQNGTVYDLQELEFAYAPPFSTSKDIVNYAGYVAGNLLAKAFRQVNVDQVRDLVENGAYIIDVREEDEYAAGHIIGAVNIPLSQLRRRISEIPTNRPIYLHCRSGQRSYNAVMALNNLGFTQAINITGSFLGICFYEYYHDQVSGRKPIVSNYNFG